METMINTGDTAGQPVSSSTVRLTRNSNAAQLQQAVEESKNGHAAPEEEKKDTAIVRISIGSSGTAVVNQLDEKQTPTEIKDKKLQKELTSTIALSVKSTDQA
jgi:hypothetical protein